MHYAAPKPRWFAKETVDRQRHRQDEQGGGSNHPARYPLQARNTPRHHDALPNLSWLPIIPRLLLIRPTWRVRRCSTGAASARGTTVNRQALSIHFPLTEG